jgi:hypothetical protein
MRFAGDEMQFFRIDKYFSKTVCIIKSSGAVMLRIGDKALPISGKAKKPISLALFIHLSVWRNLV